MSQSYNPKEIEKKWQKVWEVGCFENLVVAGRIFFFAGKHYGTMLIG